MLPPTTGMIVLACAVSALLLWPTKRPYVTVKGSEVHERIFLLRTPAYWSRSWYVRWRLSDGLFARAYCFNPEASAAYRSAL